MNAHGEDDLEKRRQLENALGQARFEATRAHRRPHKLAHLLKSGRGKSALAAPALNRCQPPQRIASERRSHCSPKQSKTLATKSDQRRNPTPDMAGMPILSPHPERVAVQRTLWIRRTAQECCQRAHGRKAANGNPRDRRRIEATSGAQGHPVVR
jgi:hypothetical protein